MIPVPLEIIPSVLSALSALPVFIKFLKANVSTVLTISMDNTKSSLSLIKPTTYFTGHNYSPHEPIILPHVNLHSVAQFEGVFKTTGMLCYQFEKLYGPNGYPYYLLISWKVSKLPFSQNQFCVKIHESKEPPLSGNQNQKLKFYKSIHEKYKKSPSQSFYLKDKTFTVCATMSSIAKAKIKIVLLDTKSSSTKSFRKKIAE